MSNSKYIQYNVTQMVKFAKEVDLFSRLIYARPRDKSYVEDALKEIETAVQGILKHLAVVRGLNGKK